MLYSCLVYDVHVSVFFFLGSVSITEALSSFGLRLSSSVMLAVIGVKTFKLRCRLAAGTAVHDCNEMR